MLVVVAERGRWSRREQTPRVGGLDAVCSDGISSFGRREGGVGRGR